MAFDPRKKEHHFMCLGRLMGPALAVLFAGGCATESMRDGDLARVQLFSDQPRAGNVYLMRGFIGIWSTGIDALGKSINESGVRASVFRNEQAQQLTETILERYKGQRVFEPLVLVAHSWGADNALRLAERLHEEKVPVDLIVTLDPVTPPRVPPNVKRCVNIYQPNGIWDNIPFFRGVPLEKAQGSTGIVENLNIRETHTELLEPGTDHYNIEKKQKIHQRVIIEVLKVCPPREQWYQAHPALRPPATRPAATRAAFSP